MNDSTMRQGPQDRMDDLIAEVRRVADAVEHLTAMLAVHAWYVSPEAGANLRTICENSGVARKILDEEPRR